MADLLLHVDAQVQCSHGAQATDNSNNTRVKVSGKAVAVQTDQFSVSNCSFQIMIGPAPKKQPCTRIQWIKPAVRVRVNGSPVLLQTSQGICQSAEQIPQGSPSATATQQRLKGE